MGLGAAMGGLPAARPDQLTFPPPGGQEIPGSRSGIVQAREVIIVGSGKNTGVFVYSPSKGAGNLIASITGLAAPGKDPFGNTVLPGIVSYFPTGPTVAAVQLFQGLVSLSTATSPSGVYTGGGTLTADSGGNIALTPIGGQVQAAGPFVGQGTGQFNGLLTALLGLAVSNGATITGGETADTVAVSDALAAGLLLTVTNTVSAAAPNVRVTSAAAGDPAIALRIAGDTFNRLLLDDNAATGGRIRAGTGAVALDTALYRAAAGQWAGDYAAFNNAGAAETWQTVGGTGAAFAGTWANAAAPGTPLQYRRNMAPFKSVHWVGRVTNTVAQVAGSQITAAVPAAYRPANTHDITCFNITTGAVVRVSIGSTGILTCQSAIAANDLVGIPDTSLGLDA